MDIKNNLKRLLEEIGSEVELVVVSKGRSPKEIEEAYLAGCRDFGESRVQEVLLKMEKLPKDIRWHFIGKLQKNKVNKVIGKFVLIHSVDSFELAEKIGQKSIEAGLKTAILLEANTSGEQTKSGLSPQKWEDCFLKLLNIEGIEIKGLMTMAPMSEDDKVISYAFSELRLLRDRLCLLSAVDLPILSMGMTHDFRIAIKEGATLVRIGSRLWN